MRFALPLFLSLGACTQDFDDQYAATEKKVKAAEAKLDAQMAKEAAKEPGAEGNNK
jgi:hypothetical protein